MDVVFLGWIVLAKVNFVVLHFTYVLAVPGYMSQPKKDLLRLIWVGENYFVTVASYLCLSGTWVFISTESRLENDFREILLFLGAYS